MTRHLLRFLGSRAGLTGSVLLLQAGGCALSSDVLQQSILTILTQLLAFGLDNVVVSMR